MRIRSIKPEFWESESLGRVSREARLLFIGLFSCCDDHGRARASSRLLASRLYPYDDDAFKRLPSWISELEKQGCIRLYQVDGESYLEIPKWLNHQKIDKPSASKLPPFESIREDSRGFEKDSLGTGNREVEQGTGNREQGGNGDKSPWEVKFGLDLPESLQTKECLDAVRLWLAYKAERRQGYKPIGLKAALTEWGNEYTSDQFPSIVQHSIAKNWQGIYREKNSTQNTPTHGPQSDPIARRNALLGDDVAQQQAEAARISRERYIAEQQRFEATGLTPFD
jgi:hypothetical protein